jgi:hypothetical protein
MESLLYSISMILGLPNSYAYAKQPYSLQLQNLEILYII